MKRRVGRRSFTTLLVAGLLFLAGATAQAGWLFVIASCVFGLVGASIFVRHNLGKLEVVRSAPRRARVGDDIRVGLMVANQGRARSPLSRLEDGFPGYEPIVIVVDPLAPGESAHLEVVRPLTRRGVYTNGDVTLMSAAPFGFVRTTHKQSTGTELTVVPRWIELRYFPILEPSSSPSDVLHERARTGAGEQYLGVREYRPGDPVRSIHWRSTARTGRLIVREFEEEAASRVSLVIGGLDIGNPPDSAYEMLVGAAASIAVYALMTGHPVEMISSDPSGTRRLSDPDRFAVLDWLAGASPADADLVDLVSETVVGMGRRGTVVVMTTGLGEAANSVVDAVRVVQSAGSRAIVVAAHPSGWADRPETLPSGFGEGRAPVKWLTRGGDLRRCLEG